MNYYNYIPEEVIKDRESRHNKSMLVNFVGAGILVLALYFTDKLALHAIALLVALCFYQFASAIINPRKKEDKIKDATVFIFLFTLMIVLPLYLKLVAAILLFAWIIYYAKQSKQLTVQKVKQALENPSKETIFEAYRYLLYFRVKERKELAVCLYEQYEKHVTNEGS